MPENRYYTDINIGYIGIPNRNHTTLTNIMIQQVMRQMIFDCRNVLGYPDLRNTPIVFDMIKNFNHYLTHSKCPVTALYIMAHNKTFAEIISAEAECQKESLKVFKLDNDKSYLLDKFRKIQENTTELTKYGAIYAPSIRRKDESHPILKGNMSGKYHPVK